MKHEITFTPIDLRTWSRGEVFFYFSKMAPTGYSLTTEIDVTGMRAAFHEDDKTFSLMWTEYDENFPAFHTAYLADQREYGSHHGILSKAGQLPPPNAYTVSCVPWVSFEHFAVHSYENKPYYFPSVEAGKFRERGGKIYLPLSITCHHAATDGWHVSLFLDALQKEADRFEKYLFD